ncbi:Cation-chloride cotransporter 1 [Morus notabilis]|uniref:Cation-chloride cotransporter 1 n=1 Tax=Morus notabilis TaxID=981085 RepID=W9QRG8_9ROSA|nr:Cation-chloride cotransporter 1 [Morus notabilis]
MDNGDIEGGPEDNFHAPIGRKYRPVVDNDSAVLEMSSIDPSGSSSSSSALPLPQAPLKKVKVSSQENMDSTVNEEMNGPQRESKLELFGFDSLVNILGLKSMTEEHSAEPSSPRDGENISITHGRPKTSDIKLGTMMGVFVPCLQNILGIIYYIRFSWIVGMAGIGQSLLLVAICGLCTFLTGISLSAIATNGAMKGGGPYYLIGRALGPEVGVSIGLCFFLGNAVAGALYVLGAVETFLKAVPAAGIFRETITRVNVTVVAEPIQSPSSHDLQIYGIVVTILLCFIVFGGVKMINRVAPAFLIPVLFSLFCIYIGIAAAGKDHPATGITGLSLESFKENWSSDYQNTNNAGIPDPDGEVSWSFNAMVGLFFPAVTGIMAGSNRSASLKDTQRSIPIGTLSATLTTTAMYLVSVLLFGALATREKLLTDRATIMAPKPADGERVSAVEKGLPAVQEEVQVLPPASFPTSGRSCGKGLAGGSRGGASASFGQLPHLWEEVTGLRSELGAQIGEVQGSVGEEAFVERRCLWRGDNRNELRREEQIGDIRGLGQTDLDQKQAESRRGGQSGGDMGAELLDLVDFMVVLNISFNRKYRFGKIKKLTRKFEAISVRIMELTELVVPFDASRSKLIKIGSGFEPERTKTGWLTLKIKLDVILGRNSDGSFSLGTRGRKKGTVVEEMGNTGMVHFTGTQQQRREVSNNYKQTFPRIFERERGMEALSTEGNMAEIAKSWGMAVVVTRRSVDTEWWELKETIGSRVARLVEVVPLTADGAVIWCKDEAERNKLLTKRLSWEKLFGGLLEIAEDTLEKSFLMFAKIKVRGFKDGITEGNKVVGEVNQAHSEIEPISIGLTKGNQEEGAGKAFLSKP